MRSASIVCLILFSLCSMMISTDEQNDLFNKIVYGEELITKEELNYIINQNYISLSKYEDSFWGNGGLYSDRLFVGIIQGKKNDTIFDILVVFREKECIAVKENPNSTFYKKGETINREYVLGDIYTTYKGNDTTCIRAHIETFQPFKIDTLKNMFHKSQVNITQQKKFDYCIKK
jgi:hypothetical protein